MSILPKRSLSYKLKKHFKNKVLPDAKELWRDHEDEIFRFIKKIFQEAKDGLSPDDAAKKVLEYLKDFVKEKIFD